MTEFGNVRQWLSECTVSLASHAGPDGIERVAKPPGKGYSTGVRVLTLTTDFGLDDWFVGTMKGVISRLAPGCEVIDITHGISPGDVWGGGFALAAAAPFFPAKTVHLAVVDPGVGSSRGAIVVKTRSAVFLGPDNGVLSLALRGEKILSVHRIENPRLWLDELSRTFHGRDVFAPVAAHLVRGLSLKSVGEAARTYTQLRWPEPRRTARGWRGEVVYVDRFGNGITNLPSRLLGEDPFFAHESRIGCVQLEIQSCYSDAGFGRPLVVPGSVGLLEVAVNGGSAAKELCLRRGTPVELLRWAVRRTRKGP